MELGTNHKEVKELNKVVSNYLLESMGKEVITAIATEPQRGRDSISSSSSHDLQKFK